MVRTIVLFVTLALTALAADISGKWTAKVPGRQGGEARDTTFTFKVEGDKVSGTMSGGQGGDASFTDGKLSGDTVTFSVETQRGKRTYTGTISGSEIKFKREGGQAPQEFTAKRSAS